MKSFIKHFVLILCTTLLTFSSYAQPELTAWNLNTTNHQATFDSLVAVTTIITMNELSEVTQICHDSDYVYVVSDGLAGYLMGPWSNPNSPQAQNFTFRIPRNPVEEQGMKFRQPNGGIGLAINGVKFYGYTDNKSYDNATNTNTETQNGGDNVWHSDAWISEGNTMDATGRGHCDGQGIYHYHATPIALYSMTNNGHSPIIGFMPDGFPIYGPFGYNNPMDSLSPLTRITSSYVLRNITVRDSLPKPNGKLTNPNDFSPTVTTNGSFDIGVYVEDWAYVPNQGHLDQFNGRFCYTPEYPNGTYAYFVTTEANGDPHFPYIMGPAYYGTVDMNDAGAMAGTATIPQGTNCGIMTTTNKIHPVLNNVLVYPNPTSKYLSINLGEIYQDIDVQIYNLVGQEVLHKHYTSNHEVQLNLDIESGVYILNIQTEKGETRLKVIKE